MKKQWVGFVRKLCLAVCVVTGVFVGSAFAKEGGVDVLLWPSGGRMQVVAQLESLRVDEGTVVQQETALVERSNPALSGLKAALQEARAQAATVEGNVAAARARIALWSGGNVQAAKGKDSGSAGGVFSVEEMQKLDTAMGARLTELYVQLAALEPQQQQAQHRVALLEQELARKGESLQTLRVTAQIVLSDAGKAEQLKAVTVRYSCKLRDCGWKPVYRFDAFPDKGTVAFVQEAELVQSTGQDWDKVRLTLASNAPGDALLPAALRDWRLQPLRPQQRAAPMLATAPMARMSNDSVMASAALKVTEQATFTTWDLGVQTVRAGVPVRLGLSSGDWKATFVRVARPSTVASSALDGTPAYLMAEVRLPEAMDYPAGVGQFFVDGLPVGTAVFSLVGDQKTLFFGTDARVTVKMKLDVRQSGSKGFVDKQQTRVWAWSIDVRNSHKEPVLVRVEDPEPQSGDTAIELKVTATPKPVVVDRVYVWTLTVPAGGTATIAHTVAASAPKDMLLDEGR
ncbi:MAG: DUF4139 domain-containing protein [Bilophila sp.]